MDFVVTITFSEPQAPDSSCITLAGLPVDFSVLVLPFASAPPCSCPSQQQATAMALAGQPRGTVGDREPLVSAFILSLRKVLCRWI